MIGCDEFPHPWHFLLPISPVFQLTRWQTCWDESWFGWGWGSCVVEVQFGAKNGFLDLLGGGGRAWVGLILSQGPSWPNKGLKSRSYNSRYWIRILAAVQCIQLPSLERPSAESRHNIHQTELTVQGKAMQKLQPNSFSLELGVRQPTLQCFGEVAALSSIFLSGIINSRDSVRGTEVV